MYGIMLSQTAGSPTALSNNSFVRSGYAFNGWNTIALGGGTEYSNGSIYDFTSNVTLYAQWAPILVGLKDKNTEINQTSYDINFKVEYDSFGNIQLLYKHNFPGNLTFTTNTISWKPF